MTPFNKRRGEGTLTYKPNDNFILIIKGTWKDDYFEKGAIEISKDGKSIYKFNGTMRNNLPFEGELNCFHG